MEYQLQRIKMQIRIGLKTFHTEYATTFLLFEVAFSKTRIQSNSKFIKKIILHVGMCIYLREVFLSIKSIKAPERNRLTDRHLAQGIYPLMQVLKILWLENTVKSLTE